MDFPELLDAYHRQVNRALTGLLDALPFQSSPLVNAMQYGALLGGKRLRPFLVYATGEMLHADKASLDAPAAAVECIHAYSLIHDDLPAMDDDALRRGQPTCHIKYGEDTAILAGDALQTLAFSILADQPMPGVSAEYRLAMLSGWPCCQNWQKPAASRGCAAVRHWIWRRRVSRWGLLNLNKFIVIKPVH